MTHHSDQRRWSLSSLHAATPLCALGVALLLGGVVRAQCPLEWASSGSYPGVYWSPSLPTTADVRALAAWDPDGPGPSPSLVVAGGVFRIAGNTQAGGLAAYDPASGSWSAISASAFNTYVYSVAVLPSGTLVAGGGFTAIGALACNRIATWNGASWSPLGSGMSGNVYCTLALPNGDLIAGGDFTTAGGLSASRIAKWNGVSWNPLGAGMNSTVRALAAMPNGDVVAAGDFTTAGGVSTSRIARWDGSSWAPLGLGISSIVHALAVTTAGDLLAGGLFTTAGGTSATNIARWDGSAWLPMNTGLTSGAVRTITVMANGDIIAAGDFTGAGTSSVLRVARWNGTAWSRVGTSSTAYGADAGVYASLAVDTSTFVVGGVFNNVNVFSVPPYYPPQVRAGRIALWDGSAWNTLGRGLDAQVSAMAETPNGSLVVGGGFVTSPGGTAYHVAAVNAGVWNPMGGLTASSPVVGLATMPNGDIVSVGGAPGGVARWNGASWSGIPGANFTATGVVKCVVSTPGGGLVVGGSFTTDGQVLPTTMNGISYWNGTSWLPMGGGMTGTPPTEVQSLALLPNGDVVAGGLFANAGGVPVNNIARWDGASWSALGSGVDNTVSTVCVLANGDIVAGGSFLHAGGITANRIARWDGSAWHALGSGLNSWPNALAVLPDQSVVAGGNFTTAGGAAANYIARWDGTSWSAFGTGLDGVVSVIAGMSNGDLAVGGNFTIANGVVSPFLAFLTTPCPATATTLGLGCLSSGGSNTLTATNLPWAGADFRATGTGMPGIALVANIIGFSTIPQGLLPLATIFPAGVPGCDLLVSPDLLDLQFAIGGTMQIVVPLPNSPSIVGASFYSQMVPIEVDAQLAFQAITATNALQLTIGQF